MSTEGISLNIVEFRQVDQRRFEESMGETRQTLEPQKQERGHGGVLHQVLKLQVRECTTEANGLVGLPRKKKN